MRWWGVEGSEDNHFSCGVAWILSIWVEAAAAVRAQETVTAASPAVISRRWGQREPSVGEGLVVGGGLNTLSALGGSSAGSVLID